MDSIAERSNRGIHLPQIQGMDEAMRACGMRPVAGSMAGLWERVPC